MNKSAIKYSVALPLAAQLEMSAGVTRQLLPLVNQAVRAIAQQTQIDWIKAVNAAHLWSGEKQPYIESIDIEYTGDFSAFVSSDYKYAKEIETGRPARDLKDMLHTSLKVRRTTTGKRFLVIPMRHNTPGNGALAKAMPQSVYDLASAMTPSTMKKAGRRASGEVTVLSPTSGMHPAKHQSPYLSLIAGKKDATTQRFKYAWGDHLSKTDLKMAGIDKATAKRYAGMVRMDTSTPGGRKSSAYLTFRVMMEGSKGWVVPAKPGMYLVRGVAEKMKPKANAALAAAIKKTISG